MTEEKNEFVQKAIDLNEKSAVIVLEPRSTFDRAIVGLADTAAGYQVVYSEKKIIRAFIKVDGMTEEEAAEYYSYNTVRALPYMAGPKRVIPLILQDYL